MAGYLPSKTIPLRSIALSMDEVQRIYKRLLRQVEEEADRRVGDLRKSEEESEEEFQAYKKAIRERAFRITITITGSDREALFDNTGEVFQSANLPDAVATVYMTNIVAFESVTGQRPRNSFELLLDFSKPPLLDSYNPVSVPTPNNSHLAIQGESETWVAAISAAVLGIIDGRKTRRAWLHGAFVYDLGLLLLGVPAGFYVASMLSDPIETHLGSAHGFLSAAAYLYVFMLTVWAYRIFFGYTKWAFPSVELRNSEDTASKHRAFWYLIIVGLLVGLAVQVLWQPFA